MGRWLGGLLVGFMSVWTVSYHRVSESVLSHCGRAAQVATRLTLNWCGSRTEHWPGSTAGPDSVALGRSRPHFYRDL